MRRIKDEKKDKNHKIENADGRLRLPNKGLANESSGELTVTTKKITDDSLVLWLHLIFTLFLVFNPAGRPWPEFFN